MKLKMISKDISLFEGLNMRLPWKQMGSFWASLVHDVKPVEDVLRSQWIINGGICFSRTFLLNVVSGWEHKMFDEGQTAVVVLHCIWLIFNSVRLETCEIHI